MLNERSQEENTRKVQTSISTQMENGSTMATEWRKG
jgi:hypothetical protein